MFRRKNQLIKEVSPTGFKMISSHAYLGARTFSITTLRIIAFCIMIKNTALSINDTV